MKKTLISALFCVSAGTAMAQVTVSGFFNASYDNFVISNAGAARAGSNTKENRVSDNTSRVLINATEDLGGGLKAIGQFDLRIPTDSQWRSSGTGQQTPTCTSTAACTVGSVSGSDAAPNQLANGNQHVGLASNYGTVRFGRQDLHYTENGNFSPVSTATIQSHVGLMSTAGAGHTVGRATRTANLIWYTSPVMYGVQSTLGYSTNGHAATVTQDTENDLASGQRKGYTTYAKLAYDRGPLALVFSTINEKSDWIGTAANTGVASVSSGGSFLAASNAQPDRSGHMLTAKYTLGQFKIGAAYADNDSQTMANGTGGDRWNRKNYQVGLGYTMGMNDFALTHSRIGSVDKNGSTQSNTGAKATTVTWAYNLSKRTALNVSYIQLANESAGTHSLFYNSDTVVGTVGSSALAGEKHSALSMGMRYAF